MKKILFGIGLVFCLSNAHSAIVCQDGTCYCLINGTDKYNCEDSNVDCETEFPKCTVSSGYKVYIGDVGDEGVRYFSKETPTLSD